MADFTADRAARIDTLLRAALAPAWLEVVDESHMHHGHAGAAPGGQTHYRVLAVAEVFAGQNRVGRSRTVHGLLAGEFASGLHALALTLRSPAEHALLTKDRVATAG